MNEPGSDKKSAPDSGEGELRSDPAAEKSEAQGQASKESPSAPGPLSAEEQMARYEDYLKENDWGHQPC